LDTPGFPAQHKLAAEKRAIEIFSALGDIYGEKNTPPTQLKYYQQALAVNAKFTLPFKKLGEYYRSQGDLTLAIWYNEEGKKRDETNYYWPQQLSELYDMVGNKDKALEYKAQAADLGPKL
jgi:tetratricopeptide (TPR) repeat protein